MAALFGAFLVVLGVHAWRSREDPAFASQRTLSRLDVTARAVVYVGLGCLAIVGGLVRIVVA